MRQAAAIAGVHPNTLTRWVRRGRLRVETHRVGGVVVKLVEVAEVERLASKIQTGRPPKNGRK